MRGMVGVAMVAFACGSVTRGDGNDADGGGDAGGGAADAPIADAMPDAAAFGPVDVTFRHFGELVDAASIFVYAPDGSFLREETTDASGTRRLEDFPRGGSVYVGKFLGGAPRAASAYGVEPGDALILGEPSPGTPILIDIGASTATAPVDHHDIGTGCGFIASNVTALPQTVGASEQCKVDGVLTVVAIAYSSPTDPSQFAIVENVSGDSPVTLDGFVNASNLSSFRVGVSNPLPGSTGTEVQFLFGWPIVGARQQQFDSGSGTALWQYPPGVEPQISYRVTSTNDTLGRSNFDRTIEPVGMENVNMGLLMLPHLGAVSADFSNTAQPVLSWTADQDLVDASDMILIQAFWDGPGFYQWLVALPAGATEFRFPAIPDEHLELSPPAGADYFFNATVFYIDSADLGFDQLRQEPWKVYPGRRVEGYVAAGPPL